LALIKSNVKNLRHEKYLFDAYQYIEKHCYLNISSLAYGISVSTNTAAKIIQIFADLGILKLIKEQERYRNYLYHDFLESMEIIV